MPRVKRSVHARKKRRKVLEQAKGYWGLKSISYKRAKEQVEKSLDVRVPRPQGAQADVPVPVDHSHQRGLAGERPLVQPVHRRLQGRGDRARSEGAGRSRGRRPGGVRDGRRAGEGRARDREDLITSAANERLKLVRKLHERRWREKLGLFAVEGEDLVEAGVTAGLEPVDAALGRRDGRPGSPGGRLDARSSAPRDRRLPARRAPARSARPDARALASRRSGQRRDAAPRRRRFRRRRRLLRGLRRPDRAEGAARIGRRGLPGADVRLRRGRRRAGRARTPRRDIDRAISRPTAH